MEVRNQKCQVMQLLENFQLGGAESLAATIARALNRNSFRTSVCALYADGAIRGRFEAAGVETESLRRNAPCPGFDANMLLDLARLLCRKQVDILHCHNKRAHVYGVLAGKLARTAAVVCTRHGIGSPEPSALERVAARLASHHVAVCEAVLRRGVRVGRIRADRASVIYNGIDTTLFALERSPDVRQCASGVLGCVARLSPEKGHHILIKAVQKLLCLGADVRLKLVGDGPVRESLVRLVRDLQIGDRVDFLGNREDVPQILRGIEVFVLPSLTEGLPLTVIEAMASGSS